MAYVRAHICLLCFFFYSKILNDWRFHYYMQTNCGMQKSNQLSQVQLRVVVGLLYGWECVHGYWSYAVVLLCRSRWVVTGATASFVLLICSQLHRMRTYIATRCMPVPTSQPSLQQSLLTVAIRWHSSMHLLSEVSVWFASINTVD